jgi:hypothetical protein
VAVVAPVWGLLMGLLHSVLGGQSNPLDVAFEAARVQIMLGVALVFALRIALRIVTKQG